MSRREIITWPESQEFMELEGWPDEYDARLINDEKGLETYGSSAYSITSSQYKKAICDMMNKRSLERIETLKDYGEYGDC